MAIRRLVVIGFLAIGVGAAALAYSCDFGMEAPNSAPEVKEGIIAIEGHPQKFTLRRVDGDPYPYYTYAPQDVEPESFSGPEGTGIRFWMNRGGGDERYKAFVDIFVFPPGTTEEQTRQIIGELMRRSGWYKYERNFEEKNSFPWSLYEIRYTAAWYSKLSLGFIAVGQHGDLYFCVMNHFRSSIGDGFIPRYLRILDEFVWTDTNERLRVKK